MNKRAEIASISQHETGADKQPDDRELVTRAQDGDSAAFRALFERYHRRAFGLALGMVKNPDDALDIVQDAFIKAHRHLSKFAGSSSFYTWFYRIVMNLSIDHIRKARRKSRMDFDDALARAEADAPASHGGLLPRILGQNPKKALVRKEIREHIGAALASLSDNHRAVLVMREVEGLSYEEMAVVMECSKGTIMSRLFHARKNMQKQLLAYMEGQRDFEA
ncbi:MAG TPA: sigma-70 family RNA polymerase sigma factor [Kofleriaceae bacterium]|nr:sigma-70 family RNA polymerase sigma factor [Kofleriaceae bacterium]